MLGVKGQPGAEKAMWEPGVQSFREGWATSLPCCMTDKKWPPPKGGKEAVAILGLLVVLQFAWPRKMKGAFDGCHYMNVNKLKFVSGSGLSPGRQKCVTWMRLQTQGWHGLVSCRSWSALQLQAGSCGTSKPFLRRKSFCRMLDDAPRSVPLQGIYTHQVLICNQIIWQIS